MSNSEAIHDCDNVMLRLLSIGAPVTDGSS